MVFGRILGSGGQLSASIMLSTGSYLIKSHFDNKEAALAQKRQKLNEKIKDLYGPIVGNRILHRSAIRALENHYQRPLAEVITEICEKKDAESLENWRGFYMKMLSPLDEDLKMIIRKNSHLVRQNEDLRQMETIMEAIAVHQYRMEIWQHIEDGISTIDSKSDYTADDFKVENNCADFTAYQQFTKEMMRIDRELIAQRNQIDQGLKADKKRNGIIDAIFGTCLNHYHK